MAATDALLAAAEGTRDWIGSKLGWLYVLSTTFFLGLAVFLMLSRFGRIRLGPDDSRPEFGTVAWFAMLFTTGMGIGLVFWGVSEPVHHLTWPRNSDYLVEEGEAPPVEAAHEALSLSLFHWGFHPWAIYIALGLSLGYFAFRKGLPLRPASALYPLLGDRAFGWAGHIVDILAVFGTLFGLATSLGLGTLQINGGLNHVFGIAVNPFAQSVIIIVVTCVALLSVLAGIDKGIRRLSVINLWLAFALMIIVFVFGPKLWIISSTVSAAGQYLAGVIPLSLSWPSPLADQQAADWTSAWTIFYWGWWISWAPFVGIFLARISYGRTIREFVVGALFAPVGVSVLWFGVFGGSGLYYELFEGAGLSTLAEEERAFRMVDLMLDFAPVLGDTIALLLIVVVTVFFITSSDSGSLVVDTLTNGGDPHPKRAQRAFWALSEGAVTLILLVLGGESALSALQAASVVTGLPFALILLFMVWGLIKALAEEPPPGRVRDLGPEERSRAKRPPTA